MNKHTRLIAAWLAVMAAAGVASAATVGFGIEAASCPIVAPGATVAYQITCTVSDGDNSGLAAFGVDVLTDLGYEQQQAATPASAVASFVRNDGFTNPAGFGGIPGDGNCGGVNDDLLQIGGAQNTIGNTGSPYPDYPAGSVTLNVGQGGKVVVATGELVVPATAPDGHYSISLGNAFAGVITSDSGPPYPVQEVASPSTGSGFQIQVRSDRVELYRNSSLHSTHPTIQDAVDNAQEGDEIVLSPGIYYENVVYPQGGAGVNFVLRSQDPSDLEMAAQTIIDGEVDGVRGRVITPRGDEQATSAIRGVTIRNGQALIGAGIYNPNLMTIENCYFVGNTATRMGGAIDLACGPITNCIIYGNAAELYDGGGTRHTYGQVERCVIANNTAATAGGGMSWVHGDVINSVINWNSSNGKGGGMTCYADGVQIRNCTIAYNDAATEGGGLHFNSADLSISIVYYNTAPQGAQIWMSSAPGATLQYCDVQGGFAGIANNTLIVDLGNNIDLPPVFANLMMPRAWDAAPVYDPETDQTTAFDADLGAAPHALRGTTLLTPGEYLVVDNDAGSVTVWGDARALVPSGKPYFVMNFHLAAGCSCINAGPDTYPQETDIDGEPRRQGIKVDIGADEAM